MKGKYSKIKNREINSNNKIIYLSEPQEVFMDNEWFGVTNSEHFWMLWRFEYIKNYLSKHIDKKNKILEIGCGNGININLIKTTLNINIDGCDLNEYALKLINNIKGSIFLYNIYERNPLMTNKYSVILLLDIIEHIENPEDFLLASLNCLKPGGTVIINVPALKILYSIYDKKMGHLKRYNKKDIKSLLLSAGLEIEYISYWGLFLIPIAFLRKLVLFFNSKDVARIGFKPPFPFINKLFKLLMRFEIALFKKPFAGTSIFVVAKKI